MVMRGKLFWIENEIFENNGTVFITVTVFRLLISNIFIIVSI